MTGKEKSLQRALEYCFITSLPKKEDGKNLWIRAIAEAEKRDGTHCYVYVEKSFETLENVIKADFGSVAQIVKIIEYYPFSYLDGSYIPEFKNKKKGELSKKRDIEDRVLYLKNYAKKECDGMTLKELDKEILKFAIYKQLSFEKGLQ